jgi:integral membrane sensor domain MASE1
MNGKSMHDWVSMVAIVVIVGCFLAAVTGYAVGAWLGLIVSAFLALDILVAILEEMNDNNNNNLNGGV